MSKATENDQTLHNQTDLSSGGNSTPPINSDSKKKESGDPTIEEHAQKLKVDAPIFAAVMQSNKWASGKRVPEADFKKAVEGFLSAPMGGKNVTRN